MGVKVEIMRCWHACMVRRFYAKPHDAMVDLAGTLSST